MLDPNWFAGLVGAFIGFLYVVLSWRGKTTAATELKDDPRVKGLLWGISGAVLVLVGDWGRLLQADPGATGGHFSRSALLVYYVAGFMLLAFATILAFIATVMVGAASTARTHKGIFENAGMSPVVEFVVYGYRDYQERVQKLVRQHQDQMSQSTANARIEFLETRVDQEKHEIEDLQEKLRRKSRLIKEMADFVGSTNDIHRAYTAGRLSGFDACSGLLKCALPLTGIYTGVESSQINANFMIVQLRGELSKNEIDATRFMYGDVERYQEFLTLKTYAKKGSVAIRLPIEPAEDHDWQYRTLPGAPEAYLRRCAVLCQAQGTIFARDVPEKIRIEQERYFGTQPFDFIVSLPLIPRGVYTNNGALAPVGVLNIDVGLNGDSDNVGVEDVEELEALLFPCSSLMAEILHGSSRTV